ERAVRSLKGGDHSHSLLTVTKRPVAAAHAVQEVLAFEPERLSPGDVWNHDFAASVGELKLPAVVSDRVLDALVVDAQLGGVRDVVEHGHSAVAGQRPTAHLVRIEPGHVHVCARSA